MREIVRRAFATVFLVVAIVNCEVMAATHDYEVQELTFTANKTYTNPYINVDLWVTLKGPGSTYRIPAFWDGGNTFRARLVATQPGERR